MKRLSGGTLAAKFLVLAACVFTSGGCVAARSGGMNDQRKVFGNLPNGAEVYEYTLANENGVSAKILTYGGVIRELIVPDRTGAPGDIVLGFDTLSDYLERSPYFGTITGRVANRVAKGTFTLDGKSYKLAVNNGPNSLHGGLRGFDKVLWSVVAFSPAPDAASLTLKYVSPDGEEGYPGTLTTTVRYDLTERNEFIITYDAETTKATPVNLTSHSYFNLAGAGTILDHTVQIAAESYTPVDLTLIPTGEIRSVAGTPFDFRVPKRIGEEISSVPGGGYDHNFVLRGGGGAEGPVARVEDPVSGRIMEISSTEPGVQFYTGNFLDGTLIGKNGSQYVQHSGFCLETQHFPDAVHHENFPSIILKPGDRFHSVTTHRFSAH